MPLADLIDPERWGKAMRDLASWMSNDLGIKPGYLLVAALVFFGVIKVIQAVKGRS